MNRDIILNTKGQMYGLWEAEGEIEGINSYESQVC